MAQLPRYQSSGIAVGTPQGQFRDVSAPFDQLSAQMNNMTEFYLKEAKVQAVAQAEEYAADKAPTIQQIEEARIYNKPIEPIADKTTVFGRAANEAQSRILAKNVAAAADIQMAQLQQDVSSGKVKINDIANQTNALVKGYSSALADVDPIVARSVEADLALSGNRLFVAATKAAASKAATEQEQRVTDSIKSSVPHQITQILAAGPVITAGPRGEPYKLDEATQIKAVIERARNKVDSLPVAKRKAAYKDIQTALKEGAERYGQEIVIKGDLNDLNVLEKQIRSGKFDFAMVDPNDRISLLTKVQTRIEHLNDAPKKLITAQRKIVNDAFNDANARFGIGNYDTNGLPSQEDLNFIYADDPVELDKKTKERNVLFSTSRVADEFKYQTKQSRDALVEASRLAGNDVNTVARYKLFNSVNESIDREYKHDPAKSSLKFAEVKIAYDNVLDFKKQQSENQSTDIQLVNKSISEYAAVTQQRQVENGVLPGDVKYFPKEWVEEYKDIFTNQIKSGVNAADFFMNESQFWGPIWPSLVKEMKLGTEMLVISNMSSTLEGRRSAQTLSNALVNKKELMDTFSGEKSKIEKAIEPRMTELAKSLRFKTDAPSIYNSVFDSTTLLAMAFMSNGEAASISDASDKAFKMVVGNAYEFADSYRIPKTLGPAYSTELIQLNADLIRSNISHFKDELEIPIALSNNAKNLTKEEITKQKEEEKNNYVDSISAHGLWVNTSDDSFGLRLVDQHGRPVRYKDGMPIELSWETLNNKGFTDLMEVSNASGIFTLVPAELQGATEETNVYNIEKKKLLNSYGIKSK